MSDEVIDARTVRAVLHAGRYGKSLDGSPLLWLHVVSAAIHADQRPNTPTGRGIALLHLLSRLAGDRLDGLRGRTAAERARTRGEELALLQADFRAGSSEREAWGVLHFRYLTAYDEPMRAIADATGEIERTLRRRLERGCQLLALALAEAERTVRSNEDRSHPVPTPLSKFIGRDAELGAIRGLLAEHRLVTLTGLGGIGKSRLAARLAAEVAESGFGRVCFVELATLAGETEVATAVSARLGVRERPGRDPIDGIVDRLTGAQWLLVLDDCEHLVAAAADLAEAVLRRCPLVQVLATSRVRLGVGGEASFPVPPMSMPSAEAAPTSGQALHHDAVRLFVHRASLARPVAADDDGQMALVIHICRQLDGIPLAIELAAARTRVLSLAQVADRLSDRFRLLNDGPTPARGGHETLLATLTMSFRLLSEREQVLFRRLCVFRGGWTLGAAESVCSGTAIAADDIGGLLMHLEARSLIQVRHDGQTPRYQMLATVHAFAAIELQAAGEADSFRSRHLDHFAAEAQSLRSRLIGADQPGAAEAIDRDYGNFRAAMDAARRADSIDRGLTIGWALGRYWKVRGMLAEGRATLDGLLASGGTARQRALALQIAAMLAKEQGDFAAARDHAEAALVLIRGTGEPADLGGVLIDAAVAARHGRDLDAAVRHLSEAIECLEAADDQGQLAACFGNLALVRMQRGEFEAAAALLDQGLRRFRSMGRTHMVTVSLINLGFCRLEMGEPGESALLAEEALGTARASGDQHREASATFLAGEAALELGDPPAAVARFDTALALSRTIGDVDGQVHALALLGSTAMLMGRRSELAVHVRDALALLADAFDPLTACSVLELAASCAGDEANLARGMRLVGAAEAERGRVGALRTVTEERLHARFMSLATNVFGSSAVKMALAEGRRLPLAEALAVAHQITRAALEGPPASDTPADCGGRSPAALQGAR